MRDQYHIDLEKYSLRKFKENLRAREMIPSRVSLKDDLDERFGILENSGITNHKELIGALRTKPKIEQCSKETGLSVEYLTLLNREAKSYLPKPIRLDKFPGVASEYVEKLESVGIKNSRHLFNAAKAGLSSRYRRKRIPEVNKLRLSGCEPTIGRDHLLRLLGKVQGSGYPFYLESNGILFGADRTYVKSLAEYAEFIYVRISYKAATPESFTTITGASGDTVLASLNENQNLSWRSLRPTTVRPSG